MSRRAARLAAVEVLYAADLRGADAEDVLADRRDAEGYAAVLVREATSRRAELDGFIGRHSVGWSLDRMSPVDRNVLRVAVLELLLGDVPPAAVIDEAVEIAKRFSGAEAGRFVNGVLGAVLQELGGAAGGVAGGSAGGETSGGGEGSAGGVGAGGAGAGVGGGGTGAGGGGDGGGGGGGVTGRGKDGGSATKGEPAGATPAGGAETNGAATSAGGDGAPR